MTLLDTGDFYGAGHSETLIGRALRDRRDQALLWVKFGGMTASPRTRRKNQMMKCLTRG